MARDPGGRRNAHTLDAQARDLVEFPTSAAKAAVRCPRVRADRSPADRAAVPPASAPLRRKRAGAHDGEAQCSTGVTPALGAGHPVERVHRSSVPGGNPRFSPKIAEVKATDQQRPAQAPAGGRGRRLHSPSSMRFRRRSGSLSASSDASVRRSSKSKTRSSRSATSSSIRWSAGWYSGSRRRRSLPFAG